VPHIREAITEHLEQFVDSDLNALLVKPIHNCCHIADRIVRHEFRDACKAVDVSEIRLHDMRHFAGHQLPRVGASLPESGVWGHTTQRRQPVLSNTPK
jgi:hypothetical protein